MNKGSKYILTSLFIFLLIISVVVLFLFKKDDNIDNKINKNGNNTSKDVIVKRLSDDNILFNIEYNIKNSLDNSLHTYHAKKIYYKTFNNINYYFIEGYLLEFNMDIYEVNNLNYQYYIMISDNNNYYLEKIDKVNNLEEYAKNYQNSNAFLDQKYKTISISKINKIGSYLAEFTNMLIINPQYAYSMLGSSAKSKYLDYNDFYNKRGDLINNSNLKIMRYNESIVENTKLYKVVTYDLKEYQIIEYYPNDFKIDF